MDRTGINRTNVSGTDKIRVVFFIWFMAILFVTTPFAFAESSNEQQTLTQVDAETSSNSQPNSNNTQTTKSPKSPESPESPESTMGQLHAIFPQLERALVIATSINLVIIIFALLLYSAKRKMNQFSPVPLASIKQERE